MSINSFADVQKTLFDLLEYCESIVGKMADDDDVGINDWCNINRFYERLLAVDMLRSTEARFGIALQEMNEMKQSDEDSKWTFPLEKEFNNFVKDFLLDKINALVDYSRSCSFNDYRARNFQSEVQQKMTMIRDFYKEEYELD